MKSWTGGKIALRLHPQIGASALVDDPSEHTSSGTEAGDTGILPAIITFLQLICIKTQILSILYYISCISTAVCFCSCVLFFLNNSGT